MDTATALLILANLRDRIETDDAGRFRILGAITRAEIDAFDRLLSMHSANGAQPATEPKHEGTPVESSAAARSSEDQGTISDQDVPRAEVAQVEIDLDLSIFGLPKCDRSVRVCLDFGTAMSKATLVHDDDRDETERIHPLRLGIPGDQEEIDELMLVSSVFIDSDGRVWFGKHAVDRSQLVADGQIARIDNIKRALSEDNLNEPVAKIYNPTSYALTYEDVVVSYLAFFTWAVNGALQSDLKDLDVPRNVERRFAMPCFPRPGALRVTSKLQVLLGQAQILADTFGDGIHYGVPVASIRSAIDQLRMMKLNYGDFVGLSVSEPLGVAGSLLSWRAPHDSLALVIDIGAGTTDFSLYRLHLELNPDGEISRSIAGEIEGTARGITEAGNHLDKILLALILRKSGVDASHPKYGNITYGLERDIRSHKESLFGPLGETTVQLYTGDVISVMLSEFLDEPAVKAFETSLREAMLGVLESAHQDWIAWVRNNPARRLTVVLTGGGATLPMARSLAQEAVDVHGVKISVAPAKSFPDWLRHEYPELEDHYPRMAVSLGGARRHTMQSIGLLRSTGIGPGGFHLDRF